MREPEARSQESGARRWISAFAGMTCLRAGMVGLRRVVLLTSVSCLLTPLLHATDTVYTQPFDAAHGWTYTSVSCGGTCSQNNNNSDGNAAPSVSAYITGKQKTSTGYWSHAYTWEALGVTAGNVVQSVVGAADTKRTYTTGACSSSATVGLQVFNSANNTEITSAAVLTNTDVSGSSAWPSTKTGNSVTVNGGYQASATTVTLRLNSNPATTNVTNANCTVLTDNYKLTITHVTPSGRKGQTIVAFNSSGDRVIQ